MDALFNLFILLVVLTVLVLLHELGHFVTARMAGVTVHEFGIGFPPRARVLFRRGDTVYTLNWLPIGGFVRLEGEERSPADGTPDDEYDDDEAPLEPERADELESLDPHAFVNQSLTKRLIILVSGAAVNFLIAWLIFTLVAVAAEPVWKVRIGQVIPDSPAETAGLIGGDYVETRTVERTVNGEPTGEMVDVDIYDDTGDLIVAIDGQTCPVVDDLASAEAAASGRTGPIQYLADRPGETVVLTLERPDGSVEDVEATLRSAEAIAANQGALGFRQGRAEFGQQGNGLIESAIIGLEMTAQTSTLILRAVGDIIVGLFSGSGEGLEDVAGPVGMVGVIGDVRTALPPVFLIWFVGLISANLAVLNLLPIPPLDGWSVLKGIVPQQLARRMTELEIQYANVIPMLFFGVILIIFFTGGSFLGTFIYGIRDFLLGL